MEPEAISVFIEENFQFLLTAITILILLAMWLIIRRG
jgi:predicted nucleic acid-binding Zn ribbon protein